MFTSCQFSVWIVFNIREHLDSLHPFINLVQYRLFIFRFSSSHRYKFPVLCLFCSNGKCICTHLRAHGHSVLKRRCVNGLQHFVSALLFWSSWNRSCQWTTKSRFKVNATGFCCYLKRVWSDMYLYTEERGSKMIPRIYKKNGGWKQFIWAEIKQPN